MEDTIKVSVWQLITIFIITIAVLSYIIVRSAYTEGYQEGFKDGKGNYQFEIQKNIIAKGYHTIYLVDVNNKIQELQLVPYLKPYTP